MTAFYNLKRARPYPTSIFIKGLLPPCLTLTLVTLTGCANLSETLSNPLAHTKIEPTQNLIDQTQEQAELLAPRDWAEYAPDTLPTTDWVSSFGSSELNSLVQEAITNNSNIRIAAANYQAARANAISAQSNLYPSLDASARASRNQGMDTGNNNFSLGLDASWEADLWGRVKDGANEAELGTEASRADFAATRLSIAGQTVQAWLDLIEAGLLLDLAHKDLQTQERALSLTQRRFESGVAGSTDVRLARSSLASSQASLATREQQQARAARSLEILLRRYPDNSLDSQPDLPNLPPLSGASNSGEMLAARPDLIAAEIDLAAQGLRIDIARKNLLPRLTLSGGLSDGATRITDLFDIDSLLASLTAGLSAPLFNAGALQANVTQQDAILRQLMESYISAVLNAYFEVENAIDAESHLMEREAALRISLEEAQQAENRISRRYSEGLATILELLDAQSRALSSESQLISARKERLANRVRLHLALGGGELGHLPEESLITQTNFAL